MSPRPALTLSQLCRASAAITGGLLAGLTALPGAASATPATAPCFGTVTISKTYARLLNDQHLTHLDALSNRPRPLNGTARPILFAARPGSLAKREIRLVVTLPPQACAGSPPLTTALDRAGITITHATATTPVLPTWWPLWPYQAAPGAALLSPQPRWQDFQKDASPTLPMPITGLPTTSPSQKPRTHAPTPPEPPTDTHDQDTKPERRAKPENGGEANHEETRTSGEIAVAAALDQLGTPFSWGGGASTGPTRGVGRGAGTTGFDCSGLTLYAWSKAGVKLGHYTGSQFRQGRRVPVTALRKGDLVFFGGGTGDPTHVGLYLGDGIMIHAPKTGDVVRKTSFLDSPHYRPRYRGAIRPA
ncbi:C40 family peptidase [Nonomuraea rhodomycinica]|uniref:C40 family peptidase n=1 Tax=Nonomuraea rhodomycinica TaxID=1712872 RepID=A0A7Y6MD43_9ACTN|nr:NlpC/P60 family protein [Nonomuraea rhodomycinica]NUW43457.1 C40 family peptidase [Nonomuraea rhodomycinica]